MSTLTVNNAELTIREWNGNRVLMFSDIDRVHGRISGTAKRNFLKNKKHMMETVDYYKLSMDEIRPLATDSNYNYPKGAIVLTKSGYLMIVKSLNDPKAWEVQRQLVNAYFMLEKIVEQKAEEKQNLPSAPQTSSMDMELKKFLEHQTSLMESEHKRNEEFRQTMLESFSAMAKIIVNQSRMIEQLCGNKPQTEIIDVVEATESNKPMPIIREINYDDAEYKVWVKKINAILFGKDRNSILCRTYSYMNKKYGICWEQEQKEFLEENGRASSNTFELIFWMESKKKPLKGLFESCLHTITKENTEPATTEIVFPIKNMEQFKALANHIAEKIGDKSPNHSVFFRGFFRYVDANSNIKWEKFENKYRRFFNVKQSERISKIAMMEFSPTVKKICMPMFNQYVMEKYSEIISSL